MSQSSPPITDWAIPCLLSVLVVAAFYTVGNRYFGGYVLDLGSQYELTPRHARFVILWVVFGSAAAFSLAFGLARLLTGRPESRKHLRRAWDASPDGLWIALGSLAAFLIPLGIRTWILRGAPVADDESAYRFMAELIASGRLQAPSPPLKLFFDHGMMINDGQIYALYFVGWPALMVPGVWLGNPTIMNPIYAAATFPALFLVLRRLWGSRWAKLGGVIYLTSPMLMMGAATMLSHTSCLMALTWMFWFLLRSRDQPDVWWTHAGIAAAFGIAFFIRPSSALAIGAPFLGAWAFRSLRAADSGSRLLAFAVPALLLASAFLAVNHIQNGSVFTTSYQRILEYARENDFRFSLWQEPPTIEVTNLRFGNPGERLETTWAALTRLNCALYGWPSSFLFLLAATGSGTALLWLSLACFFGLHLLVADVGIDTFGPTHYFETTLPFLLLTIAGTRRSWEWLRDRPLVRPARTDTLLPATLAASLVLLSLVGYTPVRLMALARVGGDARAPFEAVEKAGLSNAIVFAPRLFTRSCRSWPTRHYVFWRPNNDPDLENDVLWVNHVSIPEDQRLMRYFPDRRGYVMQWSSDCRVHLFPLEDLRSGMLPRGAMGHVWRPAEAEADEPSPPSSSGAMPSEGAPPGRTLH